MSICLNNIWEQFNVPLKKFIIKRVANEQDADDILQEVFLKIHNNIESLLNDDTIHAWIYKITRNTIIDYYRKNPYRFEVLNLPGDLESVTDEELSANSEIASCLKVMVDNLPEKYKQAIVLTEFQNMTQKELSEELGLSVSGAKSRVQRAKKILKNMILGCCQLEMDSRGNIIDYVHNNECKYC